MIVPAGVGFNSFVIVAITIAALYLTREILVPMALAVLLSFVLAPLVRTLQRWRCPRSGAVALAVACALAVIVALGTMVMVQVNQLARDLPRYQTTLGEKIHHVRDAVGTSSLLKNASGLLTNLSKELEKPQIEKAAPPALSLRQLTRQSPFRSRCTNRRPVRLRHWSPCFSPWSHRSPRPELYCCL